MSRVSSLFFAIYKPSMFCRYEAKEKDINSQRKSLNDTKKMLHEKEQVLLKEQALLNQRDENILERLAYVTRSEKKLEEDKSILEDERMVLAEEKNKLDLKMEAVASREEVCLVFTDPFISSLFYCQKCMLQLLCSQAIIQKESLLDKRESELLILQETIANKERVGFSSSIVDDGCIVSLPLLNYHDLHCRLRLKGSIRNKNWHWRRESLSLMLR
jgi:hypothetical protein